MTIDEGREMSALPARFILSGVAALALLVSVANAQDFPDHTVKIIVPSSPGGAIDLTGRVIGQELQGKWGKPVIIENRPGASMQIGADAVAKSRPDGYTLLVAHDGTMAMNPLVFPNLPYNPQKDFEPLGLIISIPEVVMVNVDVPAHSISELVAFAKKNPGQLTHATGGSATLLSLELFKAMADVDIRSIQYRGAAPSVTALIGGETSMQIADLTSAVPGLRSGRVRPLAVTSLTGSKLYSDLDTVDHTGVPGYEVNTWMGFFAPAHTPKAVTEKIEAAIKETVAMPDVRSRFESTGATMRSGTATEMRQVLAADIAKWAKLVHDRHIKFDEQ
jgi:tripartite-type tricarboxylate transporter receptor subunit TctC